MGLMRFVLDPPDLPQRWPAGRRAFITGLDGRVHPTRVEFDGAVMTCRRLQHDSGKLYVAWPIAGRGLPVVGTTSLPERETPYLLPLELARGKLSEVREQAAAWQLIKMVLPDAFLNVQSEAFRQFARASSEQSDVARTCQLAQRSLELAFDAADLLCSAYIEQRVTTRRVTNVPRPSLLGCRIDRDVLTSGRLDEFQSTFAAAVIPVKWRKIEPQEGDYHWEALDELVAYCLEQRLLVRGGPLVDFGPQGLPEWLRTWENDILNLPSFVCDFVETAIHRYTGLIRNWEVSARGNTGGALALSEEHRLALVARTLETAARTDSDAQFVITVDQPWGEYQARGQHRLSPFQFVDALMRSNLPITSVNLELSIGYSPAGSLPRDLLSVSRMIDWWSQLGLQIQVTLACPSATGADSSAEFDLEVEDDVWRAGWSEATQADWLREYVALLFAKPTVTGVFLTHFDDRTVHRFPHAGLINAAGQPKPALQVLRQLHVQTH